jgi:hypothetical protein
VISDGCVDLFGRVNRLFLRSLWQTHLWRKEPSSGKVIRRYLSNTTRIPSAFDRSGANDSGNQLQFTKISRGPDHVSRFRHLFARPTNLYRWNQHSFTMFICIIFGI